MSKSKNIVKDKKPNTQSKSKNKKIKLVNKNNKLTETINHTNSFEDQLSYELIQAQATLREHHNDNNARGLLILVNGMENAGKGDAVKALTKWMDARYLKVHATMGQHPSQYQPIWQRHTMQLPRHGEVAVYFGNWYADLIRYVFDCGDDINEKRLNQIIEDIEAFEQDLINNNTDIIKCWFSIDNKTLVKRLNDNAPDPEQLYHLDWYHKKDIKRFKKFSEKLLLSQPTWHHLNGEDIDTSNIQFAYLTLHAMQRLITAQQDNATNVKMTQVNTKAPESNTVSSAESLANLNQSKFVPAPIPKQLQHLDKTVLDKSNYKKQLKQKQEIFARLVRQRGQRHIVFVFEGMDAAGKGGAIRRIIQPLDPREFTIHSISAPTEDELKHPYLWRFWTRLPHDKLADMNIDSLSQKFKHNKCLDILKQHVHDSRVTIFDRSWYGRVLVERIEGFANNREWQRAYAEINRFEQDLVQNNAIVIKFWLAISEDEEIKRFKAREQTPNKQYKITDEDWRNRTKWHEYTQAAADMLALTHHNDRPWYIIATNDKYSARVKILDAIIKELSEQF